MVAPLSMTARWNKPFGRRHAEQRADFAAAAGLAEDHHGVRVAAELFDVVAHPLQRVHDVEHADIAGLCELLAAERRRGK